MAKAILDSDASSSDEGGAALGNELDFKVNDDFARKFTHNKKREELARLEEKLGKSTGKRKRDQDVAESSDETHSTSEEEDDEGELATEALDSEIFATLNAIKSKDPRLYEQDAEFYKPYAEEDGMAQTQGTKKEKPMYLRDYHRENLLRIGGTANEDDAKEQQLSYNQEQEALKRSVVGEMHAAAESRSSSDEGSKSGEDEFLVAKEKAKVRKKRVDLDVENADKDPENFLTNFMTARAWVPNEQSRFQAFNSDDSEDERRAEEFEEAYNLRFEDPAKSNEKLRTHARDLVAKYSVRREETNPRKKKRESEREKKKQEKQERREDKARLRKLRIEEVEEKLQKIKRAAGLKSKDIQPEDWARFVDEDWDDSRWEAEMQKRFGENYYEDEDIASEEEAEETGRKKRKPRRPKWDDDIDIKDIIPDFVSEEDAEFSVSDEDIQNLEEPELAKSSKKHNLERSERKKDAKKVRRIIEQLVDDKLELNSALTDGPAKASGFRYRDTSPTSFGLSAHDILMADDAQLNQFVGLKKLAAFRDQDKKRKDQKHLGKRARLRKWRKEAFGNESGPVASDLFANAQWEAEIPVEANGDVDVKAGGKKKRRHKKSKSKADASSDI